MKKQYDAPKLITHGSVEEITQLLGKSDQNDFLFFTGSSTPVINPATGTPATGDGSIDLRL
jgi:hypothetical protein